MSVFLISSEGWPGLKAAEKAISSNSASLDIIEIAIREVEAEKSVVSVETGGWPNMIGEMELDASIMNGRMQMKNMELPLVLVREKWLGGVTILAIDKEGNHFVLAVGTNGGKEYFVQSDGMEKCEKREAELFPI